MDALTDIAVVDIANLTGIYYLDDTTIAYLQHLFTPYAQALDQATTSESILEWIKVAFPQRMDMHLTSVAEEAQGQAQNEEEALTAMKYTIIDHLIGLLLDDISVDIRAIRSRQILPWDVARTISNDEDYSTMLGTQGPNLPVQLDVNGQTFTHEVSEEFMAGLYSTYRANNMTPPTTTMYGAKLSGEFDLRHPENMGSEDAEMIEEGRHVEFYEDIPTWSVEIGGELKTFGLSDLDFLRGAQTAAMWMNVNSHDLIQKLYDPESNERTLN